MTLTVLSSSHTSYHLPMKMEQIECSETSAYIIQTPGNYPKENIIYSEQGESLKSRISISYYWADKLQDDAISVMRIKHAIYGKCTSIFGYKTEKKVTTWKFQV